MFCLVLSVLRGLALGLSLSSPRAAPRSPGARGLSPAVHRTGGPCQLNSRLHFPPAFVLRQPLVYKHLACCVVGDQPLSAVRILLAGPSCALVPVSRTLFWARLLATVLEWVRLSSPGVIVQD